MLTANRVTGTMGTSQEGTKPIYVYDLDRSGTHKGKYYAVVSSMAIDTDGSDANSDPDHQSQTTFQDAAGKHLSSERVPFYVVDDVATSLPNFPWGSKFNMYGFQLGAVIYPSSKASSGGAKLVYAVLGDTQGSENDIEDLNHIGEGSIALANAFGINPSGTVGGVDKDVMYVFSTGSNNRITPSNGYTGTNATLGSDAAKAGPGWACQMISDLGGSSTTTQTTSTGTGTTTTRLAVASAETVAPAQTVSEAAASNTGASTTLSPLAGNSNDVQINEALKNYEKVYLSPGVYTISNTINLASGTTLSGSRDAVIKLMSNARWPKGKAMFSAKGLKNIRVTGFEIDGNRENNSYPYSLSVTCGHERYTMFHLDQSSDIEIDHMYLHSNWHDIVLSTKTGNLNFHNNIVRYPGHDIVAAYESGTTYVTNNCLRVLCNSGARANGPTGPMYVINNTITRDPGTRAFSGIEAQYASAKVYDCNNSIYELPAKHGLLSGGTVHVGGCPVSPAKAISASSCNVTDIDK